MYFILYFFVSVHIHIFSSFYIFSGTEGKGRATKEMQNDEFVLETRDFDLQICYKTKLPQVGDLALHRHLLYYIV